jgi:hypothetical protein
MCLVVYALKQEIPIFLECGKKEQLHEAFRSARFQFSLAFIADLFEALNALNLKLKGETPPL